MSWIVLTAGVADAPAPAAMVLATKGGITVLRGEKEVPLAVMDLLQSGDTLSLKNGATMKVVVLADGHREELNAQGMAKLGVDGFESATPIKREASKLSASQLTNLRKMASSQRGGVVVIRAGNGPPAKSTGRMPLNGTTILTDRPDLSWDELPDVLGYRVEMFSAPVGKREKMLWKMDTDKTKISYPEGQPALGPDMKCRWQVIALLGGDRQATVVNSRFSTPAEGMMTQVRSLRELAASEEPAEWLLAATTLESLTVYEEAWPLFEKLAEKFPDELRYHEALVEYYQRAGQTQKAIDTLEKIKKLK